MKLKGNKGEWSELYALVRLLQYGKLYAADEHLNRIENVFFPILKIFRNENTGIELEYVLKDGSTLVMEDNNLSNSIDGNRLLVYADRLLAGIKSGEERSFEIEGSDEIVDSLKCERLAAPSTDKSDIRMQIHDIHTGYNPICGFSIKSELGNPPTLLNASGSTNFIYKLPGMNETRAEEINKISTRTKILDRIAAIKANGDMIFEKTSSSIFSANLMLIDSRLEEIISKMLLVQYGTGESDCKKIIDKLEEENPLNYPRNGFYEYKFKKFLCSVALGMNPGTEWDGKDDATGGYVIVTDSGDVVAYHIYNRDSFEEYLLQNTKFERGSTSRHKYASIYEENQEFFINLNLQVRFK